MTPFLRGLSLVAWFMGTVCGIAGDLKHGCAILCFTGAMLLGANALEASRP